MIRANPTTIFKNELSNLIRKNINSGVRTEHEEYSKGKYKILFDLYLENEDFSVIIEIEFRRADPINNLIKTLHWCSYSTKKKKVLLIHIFDKTYYSLKENEAKIVFTKFVGLRSGLLHDKLSDFKYCQIGLDIDGKVFRTGKEIFFKELALHTFKKIRSKLV